MTFPCGSNQACYVEHLSQDSTKASLRDSGDGSASAKAMSTPSLPSHQESAT